MPKCIVHVTKQHIHDADHRDPWKQASCLALNDAGFPNVSVFGDANVDTVSGKRVRVTLPRKVQVAASELINGELVAPYEFEFEYPEDVIRLEAKVLEDDFEVEL